MVMNRRTKIRLIPGLLLMASLSGCVFVKHSSRDKALEEQHRQDVQAEHELKDLEKAHFRNQSPDTRKMMKKSKKDSKKLNRKKRR